MSSAGPCTGISQLTEPRELQAAGEQRAAGLHAGDAHAAGARTTVTRLAAQIDAMAERAGAVAAVRVGGAPRARRAPGVLGGAARQQASLCIERTVELARQAGRARRPRSCTSRRPGRSRARSGPRGCRRNHRHTPARAGTAGRTRSRRTGAPRRSRRGRRTDRRSPRHHQDTPRRRGSGQRGEGCATTSEGGGS